jgi:two-component system, cell cycle sensor histidine kinase and response regulator CckA
MHDPAFTAHASPSEQSARSDTSAGAAMASTPRPAGSAETISIENAAPANQAPPLPAMLCRSEEGFRALVENSSDLIGLLDLQGRVLFANSTSTRVLGYAADELVGRDAFSFVHPDDRPMVIKRFEDCVAQPGEVFTVAFRDVRKDGSSRHMEGVAVCRLGEPPNGLVVLNLRDITDRMKAEQDVRKSEAKYRELCDALPQTVFEADSEGRLTFSSRAGFEWWGYDRIDFDRGLSAFEMLAPPERERAAANFVLALAGDQRSHQYTAMRKDGSTFPVVLHPSAVVRGGRTVGLRGIIIDITKQVEAEQAQQLSEARYRSLFKNAVFGIYRSTGEGRFLEVNPALVRMLGYGSETDLMAVDIGRDIYRDGADRERLVNNAAERGRLDEVEVRWQRKDGTPLTVRLTGVRVRGADGCDAFEMIVEDVTERRSLEAQLRQAQKMEAIGRLAGGIAHDFNNLLTAIVGYSDLLAEQVCGEGPIGQNVAEIGKAVDRAVALTRQLLAFSRKQPLRQEVLDLNVVVANIEKMLSRVIRKNIAIVTVLSPDLRRVRADVGQIEQVIMNLALNARDAMPEGGGLVIETADVRVGEGAKRPRIPEAPGDYVMLRVTDSGCGMDAEVQSHLFEPFFTTKEPGKGTGFGLATVYGIVQQSGGWIFADSEPGRGSTFTIYLPATATP